MDGRFWRQHAANVITVGRLGFLPFIVWAGLVRQPVIVVGLFAAQLLLDGVDGIVARRLRVESDLGRKLDSWIDLAIWLPSLTLFVWLAWDELSAAFAAYPALFIVPTVTACLMYLAAFRYLHAVAAIHLYSGKLTSALILLLMVTMLLDRFYPLLGAVTAGAGVIYHAEALTIYVLCKDQTDENVTTLRQALRQRE